MSTYSRIVFSILIFLLKIFQIKSKAFRQLNENENNHFKASTLITKKIIIIDSGIKIANQDLSDPKYQTMLSNEQKISTSTDAGLTSIIIVNGFDSTFHIIFSKNYTYLLSNSGQITNIFSFDDINGSSQILLSFYYSNNYYCSIIFINTENKLELHKYIYSSSSNYKQKINETVYTSQNFKNYTINSNIISCLVMYNSINNFLTCFLDITENEKTISAIIFDLYLNLYNEKSMNTTSFAKIIRSIATTDKTKALVCYIGDDFACYCFVYDLMKNIFGNEEKYIDKCETKLSLFSLDYYLDKKEFILYCYSDGKFKLIKFDKNLEIEMINGEKILYFQKENCDDSDSSLVYLTDYSEYFLLTNCGNDTISRDKINFSSEENNIEEKEKERESEEELEESRENEEEFENYNEYEKFLEEYESEEIISEKEKNNIETKIIIKKINIKKSEIINKLDELIKNIEPDIIYKYIGDDYNITIGQSGKFNKNETNIELLSCENILRENYKLNDTELTIVQLEIDKNNEIAITDQVEYVIYNNRKEKLDLSYCKDNSIEVNYEIKNTSFLNMTIISKFSEDGIDVLNINDDFFNDICFPYSINKTDIILEDRIVDIYQNYSLCDTDCVYENIDLNSKIITCKCKIKTEIQTDIEPLTFTKAVSETFKQSNFFAIKCYNLVFDFNEKSSNYGFWILLILIIIHIPLLAHYFIFGIKSVQTFVSNEMIKNDYMINESNPVNKKKRISKKNSEIDINFKSNSNSPMVNNLIENTINIDKINKESKERKKKLSLKKNYFRFKRKSQKELNHKTIEDPSLIKLGKYTKKRKSQKTTNSNLAENIISKQIRNKNTNKDNTEKIIDNKYYSLIHINANNTGKKIKIKSDYILNVYEFKEAVKNDNRSFFRLLYISLLYNEKFLYAFVFNSPVNIRSLRICLVIFCYSFNLALNALFYTNEKLSERYHYTGQNLILFSFVNNITNSLFSTFANYILTLILKILLNPRRDLENIFRSEERKLKKDKQYVVSKSKKKEIIIRVNRVYKHMRVRNLIFIIFEFVFMLLIFYYITSFCCVFKSTQVSWLLGWVASFIFSIILEVFISFIIATLYREALSYQLKFIYKIIIFIYKIC